MCSKCHKQFRSKEKFKTICPDCSQKNYEK